jgi:ATP-dependent exoDNAse (exonuclease V) beta subunit
MEPTQSNSQLPLLKNGKPHVSYSEVSTWQACPYRHKLAYIDGLSADEPSPYLDYGTILHDAVESFLKGGPMDVEAAQQKIREAWQHRGFDTPEFIEKQTLRAEKQEWKYRHVPLKGWLQSAKNSLEQLPQFLEENFPGWKPYAAEHRLYESIEGVDAGLFKGFIDCIIELPNGKHVVIDWKTAGPRGWNRDKQRDFLTTAQIVLYKHFWMQVTGMPSNQIKACFILLKRESKPGKSVAMVEVSAGPKTLAKATKMVRGMLKGMRSGMALKNKTSCRFCEFANTEHCT